MELVSPHGPQHLEKQKLVLVPKSLLVLFVNTGNPGFPEPWLSEIRRRTVQIRRTFDLFQFVFDQHVFLSVERADEMPQLMAAVEAEQMSSEQARALGAPFLSGYDFRLQSAEQMSRVFGVDFAEQLTALDPAPGDWVGPIASAFGQHYVFIAAVQPERTMPLAEVTLKIEGALVREAEERAVDDWVNNAFIGYEVVRS